MLLATTEHAVDVERHAIQSSLMRSTDRGVTWKSIYTLEIDDASGVAATQLVSSADGSLHLVVGTTLRSPLWTEKITHSVSRDGGQSWHQQEPLLLPMGIQEVRVEPGPSESLYLAMYQITENRAVLLHRWWNGRSWTEIGEPFPGKSIGSFRLMRDQKDTLFIAFSQAHENATNEVTIATMRLPED
jgi:hypothetical protein